MYNAEKYIGELLDSLLAQTFKDFEVIVVNDCSTDNSAAVVESYLEKFDGRLTLDKTETNSGGEGKPRNIGLTRAQGEYVFFVDSDDFILTTALETLYKVAKENDADVVYTSAYYDLRNPNDVYLHRDCTGQKLVKEGLEEKPDLTVDDPNKILRLLLIENPPEGNCRNVWTKFVKRSLLIENQIDFANITISPDFIWVINVYCHAKRFLRLPTPLYFYRNYNATSITRTKKNPSEQISRWISGFVAWAKCFGEVQRKNKVLSENLTYGLAALQGHFGFVRSCIKEACGELSNKEIYEILCNKFSQEESLQDLTVPFFFSLINADDKIKTDQSNVINEQKKSVQESTRRIAEQETKIKQLKAKIFDSEPLPALQSTTPAVSVIIPMYNVEKYVAECLESLLAQSFQDFEVIVVDDCSTDNSVAVVESYKEKFNGRIRLDKTKTNSGGAGFPRNKGIEIARGEYIAFLDPDDTFTLTALEELYNHAKNFDADVVQSEKWYEIPDELYNDDEYRKTLKPTVWPTLEKIFFPKPTLLTSNVEERIVDFCKRRWLTWSVCLQMIRRDFLIKNQIRFANAYAEDLIFTMFGLCCATRYVVVPNVCYLYRLRQDGAVREDDKDFNVSKLIHKYSLTLKHGINYMVEFFKRQEIFSQRPDLNYLMFNFFLDEIKFRINRIYDRVSPHALDKFLRKELDDDPFTAFLFNTMNTFRRQSENYQRQLSTFNQFAKKLPQKFYAVSIIIPMYNSEKYIGELLDSILAQTFQNFEVIVVDDYSTDNSVKVVESYKEKFGEQLRLVKMAKNSGSPGEPGNMGVALSRGEYLFILDNDDTITPDALGKLYATAKEFNADVVACEKFYNVPEESWHDEEFRRELKPFSWKCGDLVKKPTLIPFDIAKRVRDCLDRKFLWMLWLKLIRRDYLLKNEIHFTKSLIQDMLATCCMLYTAERYVVVPYVVNFYRRRESSLYNQKREPLEQFKTYLKVMNIGFEYLDDFLSKIDFFQKNPESKNLAFRIYFKETWQMYIEPIYQTIPVHEREEVFRKEFATSDNTALISFLCQTASALYEINDNFSLINKENLSLINRIKNYITARIDIKLNLKGEGDFQIVSTSDDKANVWKPAWFQKGGIGYQIQSHNGNIQIVAKATADGQINLELRGLDIKNPEDKTKRIPYWIDYSKLTVNGKVIFDEVTPAWHDKAYIHKMNVKAGDEIKIQVEWLPHSGDTPAKIVEKVEPIAKEFLPYLTARMDIKLKPSSGEGDFQIVSTSDDKANVWKPAWFQKGGIGYQIQSHNGNIQIVAKATADGQINLELRGLDIRRPEDKTKRIPYWIDYSKLTVNGKVIFDEVTPAWHDKAYIHKMNVKAGDEIKIQVEWLPHSGDTPAKIVEKVEPIAKEFLPYLTARMDIKLKPSSGEGDFQIVSISDDKANVEKPEWLQKDCIGYQIQSHNGNIQIVAKATADGQINLKLRGLDIKNPEDKTKRIPYWIDYNKLTVNGKVIFDEVTPAWHDKAYIHKMDVKAGDEIKIQTEWLPHRSDV